MPKYRKLHTTITESQDVADMPDWLTRLAWTWLPLACDKNGRGIYNPTWLRSRLFAVIEDVTTEQVERCMQWWADRGLIHVYSVNGRLYFGMCNWEKWQGDTSREGDSNIPAPPTQSPHRSDSISENGHSRATPDLLAS